MEKTIYYLYEIGINTPMYVGMTKQSLKNRLKSHKCPQLFSKREMWIREAMSGGGLSIKQIEVVSEEQALEREVFWTNHYKSIGEICNMRIGNKGSEELNKIMSVSAKKKEINWEALKITHEKARGQKRSKEFCENLSFKLKGRPQKPSSVLAMKNTITEKYGKKLLVDDVLFLSIKEAARFLKINPVSVRNYLLGKVKNIKYKISYA